MQWQAAWAAAGGAGSVQALRRVSSARTASWHAFNCSCTRAHAPDERAPRASSAALCTVTCIRQPPAHITRWCLQPTAAAAAAPIAAWRRVARARVCWPGVKRTRRRTCLGWHTRHGHTTGQAAHTAVCTATTRTSPQGHERCGAARTPPKMPTAPPGRVRIEPQRPHGQTTCCLSQARADPAAHPPSGPLRRCRAGCQPATARTALI